MPHQTKIVTRRPRRPLAALAVLMLCAIGAFADDAAPSSKPAAAPASAPASAPAPSPMSAAASQPAAVASAKTPVGQLRVLPDSVRLDYPNDQQRVVVLFTDPAGVDHDVTAAVTFAVDGEPLATWTAGVLAPQRAGEQVATLQHAGLAAALSITVADAADPRPISFRNDVEAALMKAGCNSGVCHGNARGQDGFRLSLFGFDPEMDYVNLTRQTGARRVDVSDPAASLMLEKGLAQVTHGGGQRLAPDAPEYQLLADWVAAGAPDDPPDLPRLTSLALFPPQAVLPAGGATMQITARGEYSDSTDRDVTPLAVYSSLNDAVASVDARGRITTHDAGETFIMARFGTFAEVTQVIVVGDEAFTWPSEAKPRNYIDEAIHAKLRKLRIAPSEVCDDATFARRVYLDVIGIPPTVDEIRAFLADERDDKRARLIDELLQRPEFPEVWAMKWAEMLRIESQKLNVKGVQLYTAWLRDAIQRDAPMDQIVRELLTADGGNYQNPPANFYLVEREPTLMAENVAQVFLGIRIQCAQCHNHPFERWTMDDYYSFAAFFAQIGRKPSEDPRETIIYNSRRGEVAHKRTGAPVAPKFLGGATPEIPPGGDRRAVLADWLTSPDNPWFAQCFANRVWAHFMGRGLIDPPDDVRVSNPPSHPQLLRELGRRFVAGGYDIRALVRDICNSRTYQLSTRANPSNANDERNFSHARVRRLSAEQLLDAICAATGVKEKFAGLPLGARSVQVADARTGSYFLETFGRPARESACTCERRDDPTLSQALHLINGATIESKINAPNGLLGRLLAENQPPETIIETLYLAALSRPPTDAEHAAALKYVGESPDPTNGLRDLFWALLNSQEFVFQH
ncbi:MAG: DUF1553 domain-containing protein [Planctomycetota bacterium]|nr:MAG: DUF1553 domain-containing protein [Planctomycetota bacterium]